MSNAAPSGDSAPSTTGRRWPKVSFAMPILNGGILFEKAVRSIRAQDYPPELIEIVVADGGSTDNTRALCKQHGCVVVDNVRVEAEIGVELARQRATGDIVFVMAADNELPTPQWVREMVVPFLEEPRVVGAFPKIIAAPEDSSINRYLCELHVDPFTWFVFGAASHPERFPGAYPILVNNENYRVHQFSVEKFPLIAWAQGFGVRKNYQRDPAGIGDDILPIVQMIQEGHWIAYVPGPGIYHHHVTNFRNFLRKYRSRVLGNLHRRAFGMHHRGHLMSSGRRFRKYLWLLYGVTLVGPLFHAVAGWVRTGKRCWLWHFPATVSLAFIALWEAVRFQAGKLFRSQSRS